jgi:hypothetical protein
MSICGTTGKIAHETGRAAHGHRRSLLQGGASTDLTVYRCGNHFHVGHSQAKLRRRIRDALRRGRA